MPRAIITGVTLTIVVYLFVNVGLLCALSIEEIKSSSLIAETFAFELAGKYMIYRFTFKRNEANQTRSRQGQAQKLWVGGGIS